MAKRTPPNERRIAEYQTMLRNPYVRSLLDMVARYEVGTTEPEGYRTVVGGGRFDDFSRHPGRYVRTRVGRSSAAGRYQFLESTWGDIQHRLTGPLPDFGPESQDLAIVAYMMDKGVPLHEVAGGKFDNIFTGGKAKGLGAIFASLPVVRNDGTFYYNYPKQGTANPAEALSWVTGRVAEYLPTTKEPQLANVEPEYNQAPPDATSTYPQVSVAPTPALPSPGTATQPRAYGASGGYQEEDLPDLDLSPGMGRQMTEEDWLSIAPGQYQITPWLATQAGLRLASMAGGIINVEKNGQYTPVKITGQLIDNVKQLLRSNLGKRLPSNMHPEVVEDLLLKVLQGEL